MTRVNLYVSVHGKEPFQGLLQLIPVAARKVRAAYARLKESISTEEQLLFFQQKTRRSRRMARQVQNLKGTNTVPFGEKPGGRRHGFPEAVHIKGISRSGGKVSPVYFMGFGAESFGLLPVDGYLNPLVSGSQVRQGCDMVKMGMGKYYILGAIVKPLEPCDNCLGIGAGVNKRAAAAFAVQGNYPAVGGNFTYDNTINHGGIIPCGPSIC
jgi:hypothetical protein